MIDAAEKKRAEGEKAKHGGNSIEFKSGSSVRQEMKCFFKAVRQISPWGGSATSAVKRETTTARVRSC